MPTRINRAFACVFLIIYTPSIGTNQASVKLKKGRMNNYIEVGLEVSYSYSRAERVHRCEKLKRNLNIIWVIENFFRSGEGGTLVELTACTAAFHAPPHWFLFVDAEPHISAALLFFCLHLLHLLSFSALWSLCGAANHVATG